MICKTVEIRDEATTIAALAVKLEPGCAADMFLLARSGYGTGPASQSEYVMLWPMDGGTHVATTDPFKHGGGGRTRRVAHYWIIEHFDEMEPGDVVDVQFILGETAEPKTSERYR